jgi:hypothetical protein
LEEGQLILGRSEFPIAFQYLLRQMIGFRLLLFARSVIASADPLVIPKKTRILHEFDTSLCGLKAEWTGSPSTLTIEFSRSYWTSI